MKVNFSLRKIRKALNEHFSTLENQKIRVTLYPSSIGYFDIDDPADSIISTDKKYLKAVYYKKEKLNNNDVIRVRVEVFEEEIEDIISSYLSNWNVKRIKLTYPELSDNPDGLEIIFEEKEGPKRGLKPKGGK